MSEIRLEDFEILREERAHMIMPVRFDLRKVFALNDENAKFNLLLMQEYRDKNGWWKDGKIPPGCIKCRQPIFGPEQLVRYYGATYDRTCFRNFWYRDGIREEQQTIFKKYFERVANLI